MSSPSLQTVRYYVELFRNGEITSEEMHEAIAAAIAKLRDDALADLAETAIRQGVFF